MTNNVPRRVLVVEDDPVLALLLEQILAIEGFSIIGPVARLEEVTEMASREGMELALLDVNVGGKFVHPVARLLSERRVPFLFMTAYGSEVVASEFPNHNVLKKPIDASEVSKALRKLLRKDEP
jgi:DNA-binding response OmpR family regulator